MDTGSECDARWKGKTHDLHMLAEIIRGHFPGDALEAMAKEGNRGEIFSGKPGEIFLTGFLSDQVNRRRVVTGGFDSWCTRCNFSRGSVGGQAYVVDKEGKRCLYVSEEESSSQMAQRIFEQSGFEEFEQFQASCGGVVHETLCTECCHLWDRDFKVDPSVCPACGSGHIFEIAQMQNRPCPFCKSGTICSTQPDLFQ